ncbi:MAG: GNAT family N-acetyltransferase [Akkermansiaceae bacterium]
MSLEVTSDSNPEDEAWVVKGTRAFNLQQMPKDVKPLCIFDRLNSGEIVAGLIGKTYWNSLDIAFLWVADSYRNQGRATAIMHAAENEAGIRRCKFVLLDTYSFQALEFYEKLGFREFGTLDHFTGEHTRHYLTKRLPQDPGE